MTATQHQKLLRQIGQIRLALDQLTAAVLDDKSPAGQAFTVIKSAVAVEFGIHSSDLTSRVRTERIAWPQQVAYWLCRQLTEESLEEIARQFKRDHSGVAYGICQVNNRLAIEPVMAARVTALKRQLETVLKP